MADIKEIIGKVCPDAVFEENEKPFAVVPDKKWHEVAEALKAERIGATKWVAYIILLRPTARRSL